MDKKTEFLLLDVAGVLTKPEAAEFCGIDLDTLGEDDLKAFNRAYAKGKHQLKIDALDALRMDLKNAKDKTKPAMAILLRFAEEWNVLEGGEGNGGGAAEININVTGKNV